MSVCTGRRVHHFGSSPRSSWTRRVLRSSLAGFAIESIFARKSFCAAMAADDAERARRSVRAVFARKSAVFARERAGFARERAGVRSRARRSARPRPRVSSMRDCLPALRVPVARGSSSAHTSLRSRACAERFHARRTQISKRLTRYAEICSNLQQVRGRSGLPSTLPHGPWPRRSIYRVDARAASPRRCPATAGTKSMLPGGVWRCLVAAAAARAATELRAALFERHQTSATPRARASDAEHRTAFERAARRASVGRAGTLVPAAIRAARARRRRSNAASS